MVQQGRSPKTTVSAIRFQMANSSKINGYQNIHFLNTNRVKRTASNSRIKILLLVWKDGLVVKALALESGDRGLALLSPE